MNTITIKILPGLRTAKCIKSPTPEQIGNEYPITNPDFKHKNVGPYADRKYEASLDQDKVTLTECLDPFPPIE